MSEANAIKTTRKPPEITVVGKRQIIANQTFNVHRIGEKLILEPNDRWVPIEELAAFAYGKARQADVSLVRRGLWRLRTYMLLRDYLIITDELRPWTKVKIYIPGRTDERQAAQRVVDLMHKKLTADRYEKALAILQPKHAA